jgi:uncharacterized protein
MKSASFLLTENCNLNCAYCFELPGRTKKRMSWDVAKAGIDMLRKSGNGYSMMMFGGEPFLEFDLMKKMIDYALSKPESFSTQIITNATIINQEIVDWLKENKERANISVQLSIDGPKYIHDKYRVYHNGKGSFDNIIKNIHMWKDALDIHTGQLNVHGVLGKETIDKAYEIYKFYREDLGIPYTWLMPAHSENWTSEDTAKYREALFKIAKEAIDEYNKTKDKNVLRYNRPVDKACAADPGHGKPCGAGDSFFTITADGGLWPCHEFYFNDPSQHMKIGTVFTEINKAKTRVFREYGHDDLCSRDCKNFNCSRCIADNWRMNGSPFTQIKGEHCKQSTAEQEMINYVREEVDTMSLFNQQQDEGCQNCGDQQSGLDLDKLVEFLYGLEQRIKKLEEEKDE